VGSPTSATSGARPVSTPVGRILAHGLSATPELRAAVSWDHSFLAVSGPVIRLSRGRVDAMTPKEAASPAATAR
jgi:hypothetical protein